MTATALPKPGQVNDRSLYMEYKDKPIRMTASSWVEPTGAAVFFDDFLGDTLDSNKWLATNTDGTDTTGSAFAIAAAAGDPSAGHGGWIVGTPGTNSDSAEELGFGADGAPASGFIAGRAGKGMLVFETRITLPVITNIRVNAGFSDDPTEGAALAMSLNATTFTTNDADGVLWVFDTTATTDVFYGLGVAGGTDSATDSLTCAVGAAPVAETALTLRIEVDSSANAWFYQDGTYKGTNQSSAVTSTVLLTPYLAVGNLGTDAGALEADYVLVACAR